MPFGTSGVGLASHGHFPRLIGCSYLAVAAALSDELPAIVLDPSDDFAELHFSVAVDFFRGRRELRIHDMARRYPRATKSVWLVELLSHKYH